MKLSVTASFFIAGSAVDNRGLILGVVSRFELGVALRKVSVFENQAGGFSTGLFHTVGPRDPAPFSTDSTAFPHGSGEHSTGLRVERSRSLRRLLPWATGRRLTQHFFK